MNKKLLALAVAGAFVSPVAMADASVYGQVGMSINSINDGAATATTNNSLTANQSRLGFKASDDLGNGLSAIMQLEAGVNPDTGTAGGTGTTDTTATASTTNKTSAAQVFNRNSFLGLKSADLGTVLVGNYDTAYKISTRRLDVFADTLADNRHGTGTLAAGNAGNGSGLMGENHDSRWTNAIAYASPAMNGVSVAVTSRFGGESASCPATGTCTNAKGSAYSMAGMYEQGPIYATLAYENVKFGDAKTGDLAPPTALVATAAKDDDSKAFKLGGGYTMDAITVNAVYEKLTSNTTGIVTAARSEVTNTNWYIAGKFAVSGTDAVKAAYTRAGETKVAGVNQGDKATQFALGYDHSMSKNTSVYALYTKITADDVGTAKNADPSVISLGMKHSF